MDSSLFIFREFYKAYYEKQLAQLVEHQTRMSEGYGFKSRTVSFTFYSQRRWKK